MFTCSKCNLSNYGKSPENHIHTKPYAEAGIRIGSDKDLKLLYKLLVNVLHFNLRDFIYYKNNYCFHMIGTYQLSLPHEQKSSIVTQKHEQSIGFIKVGHN